MEESKIFDHFINWVTTKKVIEPDEYDGIFYPKKEDIISMHDYLIENFKYDWEVDVNFGEYNTAPLDFSHLKYYNEKKRNKWDDLVYKGAKIFNLFLEEGHPFIDGNKRTGFATLWLFLMINGYDVRFDFMEYNTHIEKFKKWADAIVPSDNIYEISMWIKENETFGQKIKRCKTDMILKIFKLVSR